MTFQENRDAALNITRAALGTGHPQLILAPRQKKGLKHLPATGRPKRQVGLDRKLGTSLLVVCTLTVGGWSLQQTPTSTPSPHQRVNGRRRQNRRRNTKTTTPLTRLRAALPWKRQPTISPPDIAQSELRSYLYSKALHQYQNENQPGKMLAMGEKVLGLDPDNPIALVLAATVLSDSLSDSDPDRQQKVAEIKNANRALETVEPHLRLLPMRLLNR